MTRPILVTTTAANPAAFQSLCEIVTQALRHREDQALILAPNPALHGDPAARITLAYRADEPVGCIVSSRGPNGALVWLGSLCVSHAARGQGIGRELVREAVADCDRACPRPVLAATIRVLEDGTPNHASLGSFLRVGFVLATELRPRICEFGTRGALLWPSAANDGTIRQALVIRVPPDATVST